MNDHSTIEIALDKQTLTFDGYQSEFDPYYFAIAGEDDDRPYLTVFADCVRAWLTEIKLSNLGESRYLPVGVYDEGVECLSATAGDDDRVRIEAVWLHEEGYSIDLNHVTEFVRAGREVIKTGRFGPKVYGEYDRTTLLSALEHFIDQLVKPS